jgi:peroxiredoxin
MAGCAAPDASGSAVTEPPAASAAGTKTETNEQRPPAPPPDAFADVVGLRPPEWEVRGWLGSTPLRLAELRGKVVLVRWFTSPSCPHCSASAKALNHLDEKFRSRGLVVLGFYHHKSDAPLRDAMVADYARGYGFRFPVAIDDDWRTLRRWWLDARERDYTSVSFLIDKQGVVRHVHPGGTIDLDAPDGKRLAASVEALLVRP